MPNLNIPISEDLRRRIKAAAAIRGMSLKDFATAALEEAAEREEHPTKKATKKRR